MITLGISGLAHDAAIALVEDGRIRFALEEERVTRRKHQWGFPQRACATALAACGLACSDIDRVAFYWDDRAALMPALVNELRGLFDVSRPTIARMVRRLGAARSQRLVHEELRQLWQDALVPRVTFVDHHLSHALYAYRASGFPRALAVVIDGRGEYASVSAYLCDGDSLSRIRCVAMPASLGFVYGAVTQHLGFRPAADEYRVMGLAAYGRSDPSIDRFFEQLLPITADGFKVNLRFTRYQYAEAIDARWFGDAVDDVLGPPRKPSDPIEPRHADIARAAQSRYEQVVLTMLSDLAREQPSLPLVLAGGCAMNSVCNGRILRECGFPDFYVPAAPGDQGAAIGAAFSTFGYAATAAHVANNRRAQIGPAYTREEIDAAIRERRLPVQPCENPRDRLVDLLCAGQVGGVFLGALEFGPRALGGRSILADPRRADMKDRLNAKIKLREPFRPFAAAILHDQCREYTGREIQSDYMNIVMPVAEDKRSIIPAVMHADGSCRFQTVHELDGSPLGDIIRRFDVRTGVPLLLNTSFNVNGEPIVMTPSDAIDCYLRTDLDFLLMEDVLLRKEPASEVSAW